MFIALQPREPTPVPMGGSGAENLFMGLFGLFVVVLAGGAVLARFYRRIVEVKNETTAWVAGFVTMILLIVFFWKPLNLGTYSPLIGIGIVILALIAAIVAGVAAALGRL